MITSSRGEDKFPALGSIFITRESRMVCAEQNDLVFRTGQSGTGSSKVENADFGEETHFDFDDNECTWLSSDRSSPRSILDEYGMSGSWTLVDKWFCSWLSRVHLSNEGASSAFASAPLDLDFIHVDDLNDDADAENWLITSTEISQSPRVVSRNESTSRECSLSRSGSINNLDWPSFASADEDTHSYLVSLMNLDEEDSKLYCDTDGEMENFPSDFPSPSCRRGNCLGATFSISTGSSLLEAMQGNSLSLLSSEDFPGIVADLENPNNEPFFWPFQRKFDWDSNETVRFLSMSPRKFIVERKIPKGTSCKPSAPHLSGRKASPREGSKIRIDQFSTRSACCNRLELIHPRNVKVRHNVGKMGPSRLSKTTWRTAARTTPL
ncbi:WD_REPEATS_REGION domain-containing protein [Psidium guajava]|nr:WD_REPEATS_REGION domain-containing protein [Psidium guajava]